MLAARMSPSTVKAQTRAVNPDSPWVLSQLVNVPGHHHRCHRGDGRHGEGGGVPDQPVHHRSSSRSAITSGSSLSLPLSSNSVMVRAVMA